MMQQFKSFVDKSFGILFGQRFRHRFEAVILYLGIFGFLAHLTLIFLHDIGWIDFGRASEGLFISPITLSPAHPPSPPTCSSSVRAAPWALGRAVSGC